MNLGIGKLINRDVIFEGFNSKGIIEYLQISISTLEADENENHGISTLEVARHWTHMKSLLCEVESDKRLDLAPEPRAMRTWDGRGHHEFQGTERTPG